MLPAKSIAELIASGAAKRPAGGGRACAAVFAFLQSAEAVRAVLRQSLAEQGLTEFGFEVLCALNARGGDAVPPSVIADACGIFRGTLTDVLARLEAAGLIVRRRNEEDRRQLLAGLTPHGRKVCAAAATHYVDTLLRVMADVNGPALAALERTLDRLRNATHVTDRSAFPLS